MPQKSAFHSEDDILRCIARHFPVSHPSLLLGRGDDCALLRAGGPFCVSSDLFLEDIHFRRSYFTPADIGHKALAVNISDIAACGAKPLAFSLNLGLPDDVDYEWLDAFLHGMALLAGRYRMVLAGGDLSRSRQLHIGITVWGEIYGAPEEEGFLARGGALPGDTLFIVGTLGLARIGFELLEKYGRSALADWPAACAAHLHPEPKVDAGLMLARAGSNARPPALMDISDGLARDLPRLLGLESIGSCEQGSEAVSRALGADIVLPGGMLHPEMLRYAREFGKDPVREALLGGEDYALLGACAPDMLPALHAAIPGFMSIGVVTQQGIFCNNNPLEDIQGFDHFQG